MKKTFKISVIVLILFIFSLVKPVSGQTSGYSIHMRRNFGYGGGSNIRGTFTISLMGDEEAVESVVFLIDDEPMATVSETPFSFRFHTDDYGFGIHRLSAEVTLLNGSLQTTPVIQFRFVGPQEERKQILTMVGGIVAAIAIALVVVAAVQDLFIRKGKPKHARQPGEPRQYGILGGTICSRCGRPFSRHIWAMNFMVGKLDRCDNCGKWSMTVRATPDALRAAEEAEWAETAEEEIMPVEPGAGINLDDTKYLDEI